MSSAASHNDKSSIFPVSQSFILKWELKAKDLKDLSEKDSGTVVKQSDLYQSKFYKDLRFFLEISGVPDKKKLRIIGYEINVKSSKNWLIKLPYCYLVSNNKAYRLCSSQVLPYLPELVPTYGTEEDITLHCLINACPAYPAVSAEESNLPLKEGQTEVVCEGVPNFTLPKFYTNNTVIDFLFRGVIPDFTVAMAIEIISEEKNHKCEALKLLCIEYLMNKIDKDNIRQISKVALIFGLKRLEKACMEKLANGYIV